MSNSEAWCITGATGSAPRESLVLARQEACLALARVKLGLRRMKPLG